MKFGPCALDACTGAILAHSVALQNGRLRKGQVLRAKDIVSLREAGYTEIIVARLDEGDCHEDEAATKLAAALCGDGLYARASTTGRVNLYSTGPGLLKVDVERVTQSNLVDSGIGISTLPKYQRVHADQMVATIKIIPYGIGLTHLHAAITAAKGALGIIKPALRTATLIETQIGGGAVIKGRDAIASRLTRLDVSLRENKQISHKIEDVSAAVQHAQGDMILILSASATSDIRDTVPSGVIAAGGGVVRFGMPVDPGNLLFLGHYLEKPVIGLPGCARAMAQNGADWVMDRVICGCAPSTREIAMMGVGGLLKDSTARGRMREAPSAEGLGDN